MGTSTYSTLRRDVFNSKTEDAITINARYSKSTFEKFTYALRFNRSIKSIHIIGHPLDERRRIGPEGAKSLFAALQDNSTLKDLALPWNDIGEEGAKALCFCIEYAERTWKTPFKINISHNSIGDKTCEHLAQALANNRAVATLCLHGNRITSKGVRSLSLSFLLTQHPYSPSHTNRCVDSQTHLP
jgi:hypothetical protein